MTVSRFHVAGMDCAAEEQLVRMALSDIDQINRIEVDLDQRFARRQTKRRRGILSVGRWMQRHATQN